MNSEPSTEVVDFEAKLKTQEEENEKLKLTLTEVSVKMFPTFNKFISFLLFYWIKSLNLLLAQDYILFYFYF